MKKFLLITMLMPGLLLAEYKTGNCGSKTFHRPENEATELSFQFLRRAREWDDGAKELLTEILQAKRGKWTIGFSEEKICPVLKVPYNTSATFEIERDDNEVKFTTHVVASTKQCKSNSLHEHDVPEITKTEECQEQEFEGKDKYANCKMTYYHGNIEQRIECATKVPVDVFKEMMSKEKRQS